MTPLVIVLTICCLLLAVLGFAAHRASICTVRAVAEVMSARSAFMLVSIGKSALWVMVLTLPFVWLMPAAAGGISGWSLTLPALAGGLLFGFGAALNGACAYSTMTRLMDGELRMATTIGGFAAGTTTFLILAEMEWLARPKPAPALLGAGLTVAMLLSLALLAWGIYELPRVWRNRPKHLRIKQMVLSPQYRLSTAAIVIGITGALVLLLIGSPGYTITLQNIVQSLLGGHAPSAIRGVLLLSVLAGMLASTLQRGSFRLDWRPQRSWLRNIFGGALMGLGTAMLPGGNDALVLYGIPAFSPHALPAYGALLLGAAIGLLAMKHIAGINTRVVCSNDIYRAEQQPHGSILNGHRPRL